MGLTDEEVIKSRKLNGENIYTKKVKYKFIKLIIESLGDPIIKILLIALGIKILFLFSSFDWYETIGIVMAIFLASFISSLSEYASSKAFEKIQDEATCYNVKVYRNNKLLEIRNTDVVVGDVIKLSSGDKIPADGHLINGKVFVDESLLSGETKEIEKNISQKLYAGSLIYHGNGNLLIDAVGDKTYMGLISTQLQDMDDLSPLKKKLRVLAKQISKLGYIGAILASLSYLFINIVYKNHFDLTSILLTLTNTKLMLSYLIYALTLSVTIIIMAVPEECFIL